MICELKWRKIPTEDLKITDYSIFIRFSIVMVGYSGTFLFALFLFLSSGSVARTRHSSIGQLQFSFVGSPRCEDDFQIGRGIHCKKCRVTDFPSDSNAASQSKG